MDIGSTAQRVRGTLRRHVCGLPGLPGLRRALAGADLAILQTGHVCLAACRAVEAHCQCAGVRLVQFDKTWAFAYGFVRALEQALAAARDVSTRVVRTVFPGGMLCGAARSR